MPGNTDTRKARQQLEAMRKEGQARRMNPIQKARENQKSLRLAVNAKCFDCQGLDHDPGVHWRIGNCECPDCPLWPVRPYQHLEGKPTPKSLQFADLNSEKSRKRCETSTSGEEAS